MPLPMNGFASRHICIFCSNTCTHCFYRCRKKVGLLSGNSGVYLVAALICARRKDQEVSTSDKTCFKKVLKQFSLKKPFTPCTNGGIFRNTFLGNEVASKSQMLDLNTREQTLFPTKILIKQNHDMF